MSVAAFCDNSSASDQARTVTTENHGTRILATLAKKIKANLEDQGRQRSVLTRHMQNLFLTPRFPSFYTGELSKQKEK